jgi:cytochrome P450
LTPGQVVISDSSAVKHIFGQVYTYGAREIVHSVLIAECGLPLVKSPALRPLVAKFVGNDVAWAEGDEHRFQRRMISPAFSSVS